MKPLLTLSILACTLGACFDALADPIKPQFSYPTGAQALFEPQWRRDFVRSVSGANLYTGDDPVGCAARLGSLGSQGGLPFLHGQYLENQAAGAKHFYDWVRGDSKETYEQMMRRQHQIAAMGVDGKSPYWNGNPASPYSSASIHPGLFRAEVAAAERRFDGDPYRLSDADVALLKRHDAMPKEAGFIDEGLKPFGIPSDSLVRTEYKPDGSFYRKAPTDKEEAAYREAVGRQMEVVRAHLQKDPAEIRRNPDTFLRDLANYYYLGIHWMPFDSVNNSILMAQVNTMLRHHGFESIPHGTLDFLIMSSPADKFPAVFREVLERHNPWLRR